MFRVKVERLMTYVIIYADLSQQAETEAICPMIEASMLWPSRAKVLRKLLMLSIAVNKLQVKNDKLIPSKSRISEKIPQDTSN